MEEELDDKGQEVIETILPEDCQGFLLEYYMNGLFGEDKAFTKGLTQSDYDIILTTFEAEEQEIFHILNICNSKFDRETCPSRKVIDWEDLESIVDPHVEGRKLAKQYFHEVTLHVYPKIRRNLRFNISELNYKIVRDGEKGQKEVKDYKMEHENDNPDNKDILCVCTFKLDGFKHKLGKYLKLLENFDDPKLKEFWDYHRIVYFIFCLKEESDILKEYNMFPDKVKEINEKYKNVRVIFYLRPPGEDEKEILNVFAFNDLGKNYYFHIGSNNIINRVGKMEFYEDIVPKAIKRKKRESELINSNKTKKQLNLERNEAFLKFWNFLKNIKDNKYAFVVLFEFEVCLRYNEDFNLEINYIEFDEITAELRTREYNLIKECAETLGTETLDIKEIPTVDIEIDFSKNECSKCSKTIFPDEDMYYCYKCNVPYCSKCVWEQFWKNKGKKKFIDEKHNLLYFKTRDPNNFKNIDKHKLGNDLFAQCTDESKIVPHSATCNGCNQGFSNSPRYICLHCRPGKLLEDGFYDFCYYCVQDMMKKNQRGLEIESHKERLYYQETRILYRATETYSHENDNHVYLMIAMQYNYNDKPYYDF